MRERLAQETPRRRELLPLDERHHHLLVRRPQPRLRRHGQVAEVRVARRRRAAAVEPGERVAQVAHAALRVGRHVRARGGDEVPGDAERERHQLAPVRRALGLGRGLGRGLERGARAGVVAQRLLRERQDRPQRGRLPGAGGPSRGRRVVAEGGGGDADDVGVAMLLVQLEAAVHDRDGALDAGLDGRRDGNLDDGRGRRRARKRWLRGRGREGRRRRHLQIGLAAARGVPGDARAPAPRGRLGRRRRAAGGMLRPRRPE